MNPLKPFGMALLGGVLAAALAIAPAAKGNVYATNIKLNGALGGASLYPGTNLTISYILNEPATLGATLNILSGTNVVRTYTYAAGTAGALRGTNLVAWDGKNTGGSSVSGGTYAISITAATSGFTNWTQTSIDSNAGNYAFYPRGIDVDKNTNSPFYGRVIMSCALSGSNSHGTFNDGFYKMNADGSKADEGWYGYANYTQDDGYDGPATGKMPNSFGYNPLLIRIGEDDRVYWCDNASVGAINACDMQTTTNQNVINSGFNAVGYPGYTFVSYNASIHNYENNPEIGYLVANGGFGIQQFDVTGTTSTNAAVWLMDTGDYQNWGVWMYHLINGQSDTNDTYGTQAVSTGGDIGFVTGGGVMVDTNLDIFVGQTRGGAGAAPNREFLFTNWNSGILPPDNSIYNVGEIYGSVWQVGAYDDSFTGVNDTVLDSRTNPKFAACPMLNGAPTTNSVNPTSIAYNNRNGGIRLLNVADGSVVTVTNASGSAIQTLTNLDFANWYTCAAWDNVGNLYAASSTTNLWRVWSPPGTNSATTLAVATVTVIQQPVITSITVTGTSVTINFTGSAGDAATAFTLLSSATVTPASSYTAVGGATLAQLSPGIFRATATGSAASAFYRIKR